MLKFVLAVTIVFIPSTVFAQFYDGNMLYQHCIEKNNITYRSISLGYVVAIIDTQLMLNPINSSIPLQICAPTGVTAGQLVDIVCKGLTENPVERHLSGSFLASKYLSTAFPCRR